MTDKEEITTEQMQELIRQEKLERAARCKAKIEKVLAEDRCQFRFFPFLDDEGRTKAGGEVVAL